MKTKLIRENNKYRMFAVVSKLRGRGSKFQWNSKNMYVIVEANTIGLERKYTYKTREEADKAWLFLTLRDV